MISEEPLYEQISAPYAGYRRPDPRIARLIEQALGGAQSVLNVGAGAGSYEPHGRTMFAVEPALAMLQIRPPSAAPALRASADHLPFRDGCFEAALALLTVHHWPDRSAGLRELARVSRERVVIFTWDPHQEGFWLVRDYFDDILQLDRAIFPSLQEIASMFSDVDILPVPIPHDCTDGFLGAYWRRPEMYLDPEARRAISSFSRVSNVSSRIQTLQDDLRSGSWQHRNRDVLDLDELDIGYRLIVARAQT